MFYHSFMSFMNMINLMWHFDKNMCIHESNYQSQDSLAFLQY